MSFEMMKESELVAQALEKTNAHALARLVNEKRVYTRVLWLLAWLVCCGLFIRQLVGFINRLQANDVTTNFRADAVRFEYPDLFFCFDNPMSGSRHLEVSDEFVAMVHRKMRDVDAATEGWCSQLPAEYCSEMKYEAAEMRMNSMQYRHLADEMGHTLEQSVFLATLMRTNGLKFNTTFVDATPFYHPMHLRCFKISLNKSQRDSMRFTRPDDSLHFEVMIDAPDSRMGRPTLPVISNEFNNFTAPFWALDKVSLASKFRSSNLKVYITRPGHYPSEFDDILVLEGGRSYTVQLEMKEQVHTEDSTQCIESPQIVEMVNPYDNSAYRVAYDYGYCYNNAMQAQFRRLLNASLGYLPQPWPPADRLLFNLSSGWGTNVQDIATYLERRLELSLEEPLLHCSNLRPCTERMYFSSTKSIEWPVDSIIEDVEGFLYLQYLKATSTKTALEYLAPYLAAKNHSQVTDYLRTNMLRLKVSTKKPMADRVVFTRAYNFESFVADVGGILGIYLGMSVLTFCELVQFLHDLLLLMWAKTGVPEDDEKKIRH